MIDKKSLIINTKNDFTLKAILYVFNRNKMIFVFDFLYPLHIFNHKCIEVLFTPIYTRRCVLPKQLNLHVLSIFILNVELNVVLKYVILYSNSCSTFCFVLEEKLFSFSIVKTIENEYGINQLKKKIVILYFQTFFRSVIQLISKKNKQRTNKIALIEQNCLLPTLVEIKSQQFFLVKIQS